MVLLWLWLISLIYCLKPAFASLISEYKRVLDAAFVCRRFETGSGEVAIYRQGRGNEVFRRIKEHLSFFCQIGKISSDLFLRAEYLARAS